MKEIPDCSKESIAIAGLLHDLCKANFYVVSSRNVKNESTGQWEKQPFYTVDDQLPLGHGTKSVILIMKHMQLKDEEIAAIVHHMGAYGAASGDYTLTAAFEKYPLALFLHMADMMASHYDEVVMD